MTSERHWGIDRDDVFALEAIAARSWLPLEEHYVAGWWLRAANGWTGRANSALPGPEPVDLDAVVSEVVDWYQARGLPPMVAVPLPGHQAIAAWLAARGWTDPHGGVVMTAPADVVLECLPDRKDLPAVQVTDECDDLWLAAYHYRGGTVPAHAIQILASGGARFARISCEEGVVAVGRVVVDGEWAGLTAMEVGQAHRGGGLGAHLLRGMVTWAVADKARRIWLQVAPGNERALRLYQRAGFARHHTYRYFVLHR